MKIIHISDLHFHRNNKDNKIIIETLNNINTKYPKHYIVVTGDIVDDGHKKQYENAFKVLKQFQGRIFIVPGNHDFGALGSFYSKEKAKQFDEMLSIPLGQEGAFLGENKPVVNVVKDGGDTVAFIALDTNLETDILFDFACGEVGSIQLETLSAILANLPAPETKKVLFFHHHPFMHNDPFMELKDARKLARLVYNKVDVILFGHKHVLNNWQKRWGTECILASDNCPGKSKAGEITIQDGKIKTKYVDIG